MESVWFGHRHLTKKMYTAGLVIFSCAVAVAVVMLGVNGFASTKHIEHVIAYETEEEEPAEKQDVATILVEEQAEESQNNDATQVMDLTSGESDEELVPLAESEISTETVTMTREESADEMALERNFRTQVNNIEESEMQLLSMEDYTALIRIVEAEATDEDFMGKVLVANVVMNRVEDGGFPDSIYEVVHEKLNGRAQFSPIDDGRYYSVKITDSTVEAVKAALSGSDYSKGALFFVAKPLASAKATSWFDKNLDLVLTHGVHSFYKY